MRGSVTSVVRKKEPPLYQRFVYSSQKVEGDNNYNWLWQSTSVVRVDVSSPILTAIPFDITIPPGLFP